MTSDDRGPAQRASLDPRLEDLLAPHGQVPRHDEREAVEVALYAPRPFALEGGQATALRVAAIRASFRYHVEHNAFYRRYCAAADVSPEDVAQPADLHRIPLVPAHLLKGCPQPAEFVQWLASISSDEVPWPAPGSLQGSYDEQMTALSRRGIQVRSTSGSSGVPSFLPRDPCTRRRSAHWKILTYCAMYPEILAFP